MEAWTLEVKDSETGPTTGTESQALPVGGVVLAATVLAAEKSPLVVPAAGAKGVIGQQTPATTGAEFFKGLLCYLMSICSRRICNPAGFLYPRLCFNGWRSLFLLK